MSQLDRLPLRRKLPLQFRLNLVVLGFACKVVLLGRVGLKIIKLFEYLSAAAGLSLDVFPSLIAERPQGFRTYLGSRSFIEEAVTPIDILATIAAGRMLISAP